MPTPRETILSALHSLLQTLLTTALRGDWLFIEGEHPGSTYIAVEAPFEPTLHLLQARLLDLGENVYIRIERAA